VLKALGRKQPRTSNARRKKVNGVYKGSNFQTNVEESVTLEEARADTIGGATFNNKQTPVTIRPRDDEMKDVEMASQEHDRGQDDEKIVGLCNGLTSDREKPTENSKRGKRRRDEGFEDSGDVGECAGAKFGSSTSSRNIDC
jgi:hypothetical protein